MDFALTREPDSDIRRSYPVRSRVFGWYLRVEELPTGYWQVKGRNRHGDTLSLIACSAEEALEAAELKANEIRPG